MDIFLTHAQLNQNLSMDLRVSTAGGSRKTALEELHEMNGGRRFEFEKGSNISGLYENEGTNVNSSCKYIVRELMPGSIMRKFETDLSHVHGSHIWYGNHGPTLGGLGGAFEGDPGDGGLTGLRFSSLIAISTPSWAPPSKMTVYRPLASSQCSVFARHPFSSGRPFKPWTTT